MGLVSDYFEGIKWIDRHTKQPNLVLWLGSSIGNFQRKAATHFLTSLWNAMKHDDCLLTGFDLRKSADKLQLAYSDPHNITRDFNYNLLSRINKELGGDFEVEKFQHVANYNYHRHAMESFLVATEAMTVTIEATGRSFEFVPWEPIHTESSCKYSMKEIAGLAEKSGFKIDHNYFDNRKYFVDSLWRVQKEN